MASQAVNRSSWLSGTFGEVIAEFFGTMTLILFGDGVVATFKLFNPPEGNPFANEWIVVIMGWGLAVMLGIYVAGAVSGAHLNPAVTLGLAVTKRLSWNKVLPYWAGQVLGAFIAAAILFFIYYEGIFNALGGKPLDATTVSTIGGVFYTSPAAFVTTLWSFSTEFFATILLLYLILAITDGNNQPVQGNLNPLIIGFLIVAIGASFGLNTGYAINPARDFGPRLLVTLVGGGLGSLNSYTWIPIVAPLLGGAVGALLYDVTMGRVITARGLGKSGDAVTKGDAVREPSVD